MANMVQKYFNITDKEWNRLPKNIRINKAQQYRHDRRDAAVAKNIERRKAVITDRLSKKRYGAGKDSRVYRDSDIVKNLNKAGYDIKRKTPAYDKWKERFGAKK